MTFLSLHWMPTGTNSLWEQGKDNLLISLGLLLKLFPFRFWLQRRVFPAYVASFSLEKKAIIYVEGFRHLV